MGFVNLHSRAAKDAGLDAIGLSDYEGRYVDKPSMIDYADGVFYLGSITPAVQ